MAFAVATPAEAIKLVLSPCNTVNVRSADGVVAVVLVTAALMAPAAVVVKLLLLLLPATLLTCSRILDSLSLVTPSVDAALE